MTSTPPLESPAVFVMGERNSGTNYLDDLIQSNLGVVTEGGVWRWWYAAGKGMPASMRESWLDAFYQLTGKTWKHALLAQPLDDVFTIGICKHPLSWSLSMLKRPYQLQEFSTWGGLVTFPWRTSRRDGCPEGSLAFEVWMAKLEALEANADLLIRYEDLLRSPTTVLAWIASRIGVDWDPTTFVDLATSTKTSARSTDDIRRFYLNEEWRDQLPEGYAGLLPAELSVVAKRLGYRLD